ncbi:serine/threonine protein phosphatase [Besnoitia besnoiti]|uniref:protein-serine/threonine phosphatase n=1 Tax=Besnoitia besnoiti TaxID=94643 RepID=A0A2A9MES6_BESBE|nr:serine/threonine protein phosphatase [Besnoitia besnoiti]PFH34183.1 serine/threonine protein phosphatase [Besnoitia besnoiti]
MEDDTSRTAAEVEPRVSAGAAGEAADVKTGKGALPSAREVTKLDQQKTLVLERARREESQTQEEEAAMEECYDDMLQEAEKLKAEGNTHFKNQLFHLAVEKYTAAIDLLCDNTLTADAKQALQVLLCNRAFCQIKLENYGSAVVDAERVIQMNPLFAKAYYRRGCAYCCLSRYKKAQKDFERVIALSASPDPSAISRLNECKKQIRLEAFAAAIETEKTMRASEAVRKEGVESLFPVEKSYDGPVYSSKEEPSSAGGADLSEFVASLKEYLKDTGKRLHKQFAYRIVLDVISMLSKLQSLERITIPEDERITVCGDIHGQYYDLCNIFDINGMPSKDNPYLFNGDFVDRGSFSVECILLLYAAKLAYPQHFHLTRGNHETFEMNRLYGFRGEVIAKYDERLYNLFCESFRLLPLAFVLNDAVFVVHGGLLSSDNITLDDIQKIDRDREPPDGGLMTDLLWSDPSPVPGRSPSKRGVACQFGPDVTAAFLKQNNLKLVIRSHEMKDEGYEVCHGGQLVTVFSAPNYCDQMKNKGAFIKLDGKTLTPQYTQFDAVPHPATRPMQYANPMLSFM